MEYSWTEILASGNLSDMLKFFTSQLKSELETELSLEELSAIKDQINKQSESLQEDCNTNCKNE